MISKNQNYEIERRLLEQKAEFQEVLKQSRKNSKMLKMIMHVFPNFKKKKKESFPSFEIVDYQKFISTSLNDKAQELLEDVDKKEGLKFSELVKIRYA